MSNSIYAGLDIGDVLWYDTPMNKHFYYVQVIRSSQIMFCHTNKFGLGLSLTNRLSASFFSRKKDAISAYNKARKQFATGDTIVQLRRDSCVVETIT